MMRKFTIYNLQFTILIAIFAFSFYILHSTFYIPSVLALESTPSSTINKLKEEFEKAVASKAALLKEDVDRKLRNKAYIGKIKSKSDTSLTLATESNPKIVSVNQDTVFESRIKKKIKLSLKTLAEEDYIAALGDTDEVGVLTAKKIILLPEAKSEKPKAFLWGQIISISDKLSTLRNKDSKNTAVSLPASKLKINDFVILTGTKNQNDIFDAGFVYVIPQGGVIKSKKVVYPASGGTTSSAQTASPSARLDATTESQRAKPTKKSN